ncbi:unnamed protein product [Ostreobium quekettii]|uniref:ODAD1 central coiled coil region domain-containing protein n=1 Tax=Ostreobium quekettii TaxID=121088 RepID=A0A8S1JCP5_9CHLO|nr:unnamed protein product [Ostreobium quekettii]
MKPAAKLKDSLSHTSVASKQRHAIDKLREDNNKLKEELLLENKFCVQPANAASAMQICKLQDEADLYTRKIELERRKIGMLDQRIEDCQSKIITQRRKMGGINAAREGDRALQKQIKILENRLEKAYVKYNEGVTQNKRLREMIDNLRRERMMFENINHGLDKELHKLKREMASIMEAANTAYDARERAIAEMGQLKVQADKEQQGFEEEWRHLSEIIDEDRKAREAQRMKEMVERERKTQELLRSRDHEVQVRKKAVRGAWNVAGKQAMAQNMAMEKVQQFGAAFEMIQQATGIKDIDELVNTIISAEDQNFTLLNYVNELNQEIEKLEEQISEVHSEIEVYKGRGLSCDNQRKAVLKDLEERLRHTEDRADQYERSHDVASCAVASLKSHIWKTFNDLGCNTAAVSEVLGDGGITEGNLMQYLGIIELRAAEILQIYAHLKIKMGCTSEHLHAILGQATVAGPGSRIAIEPPSTQEDDLDDSDIEVIDDEKPLTRENLQARVAKSIARKGDNLIKIRPINVDKKGKK